METLTRLLSKLDRSRVNCALQWHTFPGAASRFQERGGNGSVPTVGGVATSEPAHAIFYYEAYIQQNAEMLLLILFCYGLRSKRKV